MAVKLHRCSALWFKSDRHACWRVQSALDEQGIEYEIVKVRSLPRSMRTDVIANTGQSRVPAIEFADGRWYRAESKDMAARIRAGMLGQSGEASGGEG